MGKTKMTAEFLHDSTQLFGSAQRAVHAMVNELRSGNVNVDHVSENLNQLFRDVHSIKSEASFLHLETFTRQANDLETVLDAIRRGKEKLNLSVLDEIGNTVEGLKLQVQELEASAPPASEIHTGDVTSAETEYLPFFNEFEKDLMEEARERGEALYRLVCEVDNSESMKYPRVFLIINNLEQLVNVIKVDPSIEKIEKDS
jgi:two-component system chemotaxis sensor kinase CheA